MSLHHRFEALVRLGFSAFFQHQYFALLDQSDSFASHLTARVLAEARGQFLLGTGVGTRSGVVAGRLRHDGIRVCVGDFVLISETDPNTLARIEHVFDRSSLFQRKTPGGTSEPQLIAANVDLGIVVCALAPEEAGVHVLRHGLNPRRIERYLRAIRDAPARALVDRKSVV